MNLAQEKLYEDIYEMSHEWIQQKDFERNFLVRILELARIEAPVFKMLNLWFDSSKTERNEIIADLHEMLEDSENRPSSPVDLPYININKLSGIADQISAFKKALKKKVQEKGGVTKVSKMANIPQPSLSRFLNSTSLPRKSTLEKLSKALNLSQADIAFEWTN